MQTARPTSNRVFYLNEKNREFSIKSYLRPRWSSKLFFVSLFLVVVFLLSIMTLNFLKGIKVYRLYHDGVTEQGSVIQKNEGRSITYGFWAADGEYYTNQDKIPPDVHKNIEVGDTVSVLYMPDDPASSVYTDGKNPPDILFYSVVLVVPVIFWGLYRIFTPLYVRIWGDYMLVQKHGRVIGGTIVHVQAREKLIRGHFSHEVTVYYTFDSPVTGKHLSGMAVNVRNDWRDYYQPREGTPVRVLYVSDQLYGML